MSEMALIYFYDSTELDREQLTNGLQNTDHHWEFVSESISVNNINPDTEVISVFVTSSVTAELFDKLPNLKLIACRSTGFNHIDLKTAKERGVTIVNVPTYGESTVAEYAFTLLLAITRKLPQLMRSSQTIEEQTRLIGTDLHGKTIGIIGTGHIGQHAIRIARGFSMEVVAYDAFPNEGLAHELGFTYVPLDKLLAESDVVSVHVPYLPSTHHILNQERLLSMKQGAILINTARGELVESKGLVVALESGRLGGAGLDVIEGEILLHESEEAILLRSGQVPSDILTYSIELSALKKMPNVIISPHNAFNTTEAIGRINGTTTLNIVRYWYGEVPNEVKPPEKQMGKLIVSRHAESEWNATGQWSGIRDVHLSEKGFKESGMLGRALRDLNIKIDIAYCSEQIRTRETLEGILEASTQYDVEVIRTSAMNERDYGDYTGKNKWQMKEEIGEVAWDAIRRGWDVPVPNGETLKMVYARVLPFYLQTIVPLLRDGKNVLLVAHGNSIRALIKYIESVPEDKIGEVEMLFGDLLVYDVDQTGLQKAKSVSHIDSPVPHA